MLPPELQDYVDDKGNLYLKPGVTLVDLLERNTIERADTLAYRFVDYSRERDGEYIDMTWGEFGVRVSAVANRLSHVTEVGDRVAILATQSLDYVTAFFGALYAGCVAVPLFAPEESGHSDRLRIVLDDCKPSVILTTTASAEHVRNYFRHLPAKERPRSIAVDAIPGTLGAEPFPRRSVIENDTIAYLQYTSGSTRSPAGVQITFEAVGVNVLQMIDTISLTDNARGVTWLPMFHDMGLLTVILPIVGGRYMTIMSPTAFVRRPHRWIHELSAQAGNHDTFAAAPNFAFEHSAARGLPKEGEPLDLSNVIGLINGSEPVTIGSMTKFNEAFAPYGLSKTAIKPSYGMAEATLFVSSTMRENEAKVSYADRDSLTAGKFVLVDEHAEGAVPQVSSGQVAMSQWAVIVRNDADVEGPNSGVELPDGTVGEIWLQGKNIGTGYWGRAQESIDTFQNKLTAPLAEGSHSVGGDPDGIWMATGDLGVYLDGELYITGRVKDLIIVDGRNHYPQDVEITAQESAPQVRSGFVAAFAVKANELPQVVFDNPHSGLAYDASDESEQLVIVAERAPRSGKVEPETVANTIRTAVAGAHGVMVRDVLFVPAGSIPRTSSGKIARRACKAAYLDGTLRGGYTQAEFPDADANQ